MNEVLRPRFLIIGAQKGGTTALYEYLCMHPAIGAPTMKEIDFFNCDGRYGKGIDSYHEHFPRQDSENPDRCTFDATPGYLACTRAAERVHRYDPSMRLIAVLRDPVERAHSAWQMYRSRVRRGEHDWYGEWMRRCTPGSDENYVRRGEPFRDSFEFAVIEELAYLRLGIEVEAPVLLHGRYHEQLRRWLDWFPEDQLLLVSNTELRNNTRAVLARIEAFVDLPPHDWEDTDLAPRFEGGYTDKIPSQARTMLHRYYADVAAEISHLAGEPFNW